MALQRNSSLKTDRGRPEMNLRISWSHRVFLLVVSFIFVGLGWLVFAELDQVVRMEGVIEPKEKVQEIASRYPGRVDSLAVGVGDRVKMGDLLVMLDDTEAQTLQTKTELALEGLAAKFVRLNAELKDAQDIQWPSGFSAEIRMEQDALFLATKSSFEAKLSSLEQEMMSLKNQLAELQARRNGNEKLHALKLNERSLVEPLVRDGIEPSLRLLRLDQEIAQFEMENAQSLIKQEGIQISLKKVEESRNEAVRERVAVTAEILVETKNQMRQLETELISLSSQVKAAALRAPIDGYVTKVGVSGRGAIVAPGEMIIEVIPDTGLLQVKCRLRPQDLSNISVGQRAKISLSAYDFTKHGYLSGRVLEVAKNTTQGESVTFYETWVQITSMELSKSKVEPLLVPGMSITVDVEGERQSVLDYLLKPVKRTTSRALTET